RTFHVLDAVVDEEGAARCSAVTRQHLEEGRWVGLAQAQLAAVIGAVEEALEVDDAVLARRDGLEGGRLDVVGVAEEQHLVVFLQPFHQGDARRRDAAQHGVPASIYLRVGEGPAEKRADAVAELRWGNVPRLETVEEVVLPGLAVERSEIAEPQVGKSPSGGLVVNIDEHAAEIEQEGIV